MRATPLGIGEITSAKNLKLLDLRSSILTLMREMAQKCFVSEPLIGITINQVPITHSKHIEIQLVKLQAQSTINAVWSEQARMRVQPALDEDISRYFKFLIGCLHNVDNKLPVKLKSKATKDPTIIPAPQRTYYNIPVEIQDLLTTKELDELKMIAKCGGGTALFQQVIIDNSSTGLTSNQVVIVRDIHRRAQEKHTCPNFGAKEDFTLQLHIDARMLPTSCKALATDLRDGVGLLLKDDENKHIFRFLDISALQAYKERIRIPLVITKKISSRMESTNPEWASLILEISENAVGVRMVCGKPKPVQNLDLTRIKVAVSRDFGYANTVALSVIMSDDPINLDTQKCVLEAIKSGEEAKAYIESRALPSNVKVVERILVEGRNFLKLIEKNCLKIDDYRSRIDLLYGLLERTKTEIVKLLQLGPEDVITPAMKKSNAGIFVRSFYQTLGVINDLKKARRKTYRKISAVKKNWFGLVSNLEISLAKKYNAVLVRENLTVEAIEKDAPDYKGRAFNKMINNGSKGQYQKRATDKLLWNGIPEVVVPSWYTSRSCLTHSQVIEKKHRKGEDIFLPCCDKHDHADMHAADTIGGLLFTKSKKTSEKVNDSVQKHQQVNAEACISDKSSIRLEKAVGSTVLYGGEQSLIYKVE